MPKHSLPDLIQYARRRRDRESSSMDQGIVELLEWLHANEKKIKAKIEEPPALPPADSGRVYTQRQTAFVDFSKGGWEHRFEVYDDTGALVGFRRRGQDTRTSPVEEHFVPYGSQAFDTPAEFIAAYESGAWKPREPEQSQEASAA